MLPGVSEEQIRADVEEHCSFAGRLAGTDAERRASNRLAERLGAGRRRARVEAIYVQPQWAFAHLLTCLMAVVGSTIAATEPPIGFVLVLVASVSAYLDLQGRRYLIRRLLFRRASQNVHTIPAEGPTKPTVLLCASVDAPPTGVGYNRLGASLTNLAARSFPVAASPTRIWFWSMALLLPPLGARLAGFDPNWLAALQLPQTLILIVSCFLLGEIALSTTSPGANANASGVAAVLEVLRRIDSEPPEHVRVDVVLVGGGETTMQGMREFIRAHREELPKDSTWFLSFDSVGRGEPRFVLSQGLAVTVPMDPDLAGLMNELSGVTDEQDEGARRAEPIRDGRTSAALIARTRGFRALPLTCREPGRSLPEHHHTRADTPAEVDPEAIAAVSSLAVDAIRLLDLEVGRSESA